MLCPTGRCRTCWGQGEFIWTSHLQFQHFSCSSVSPIFGPAVTRLSSSKANPGSAQTSLQPVGAVLEELLSPATLSDVTPCQSPRTAAQAKQGTERLEKEVCGAPAERRLEIWVQAWRQGQRRRRAARGCLRRAAPAPAPAGSEAQQQTRGRAAGRRHSPAFLPP